MATPQYHLPEALTHVLYEMEMLHGAAALIRANQIGTPTHNAALESFIVHARCLEEFFCKPEKADDNMQPHHFLAGYPKQTGSAFYARMHKEIAHLTYSRKRPGERRPWKIGQVLGEVANWSLPFLSAALAVDELTNFANNRSLILKQIESFRQVQKKRALALIENDSGTTATTEATVASTYLGEDIGGTGSAQSGGVCL